MVVLGRPIGKRLSERSSGEREVVEAACYLFLVRVAVSLHFHLLYQLQLPFCLFSRSHERTQPQVLYHVDKLREGAFSEWVESIRGCLSDY